MDYKEKYEQALERARKFATDLPNGRNDRLYHVWDLENIFPELAESEDERIRKEIITYLSTIDDKDLVPWESWIAWLEKQVTPQTRTGIEWVNAIDDACDKRYSEEYAHGEYCHEQSFKWGFQEGVDWLEKQGENKSSWSEEDEKFFTTALWHISNSVSNGKDMEGHCATTEWLKSLKDRVQPQSKQEWSEEDEITIGYLCKFIDENGDKFYGKNKPNVINWLKSIKPNHWKPSEKQMEALNTAVAVFRGLQGTYPIKDIESLYNELKTFFV